MPEWSVDPLRISLGIRRGGTPFEISCSLGIVILQEHTKVLPQSTMSTRTTRVYSITMPPEMGRQAEQLAKRESRTMSELMREAFRRYQIEEAERRLLTDPMRSKRLAGITARPC